MKLKPQHDLLCVTFYCPRVLSVRPKSWKSTARWQVDLVRLRRSRRLLTNPRQPMDGAVGGEALAFVGEGCQRISTHWHLTFLMNVDKMVVENLVMCTAKPGKLKLYAVVVYAICSSLICCMSIHRSAHSAEPSKRFTQPDKSVVDVYKFTADGTEYEVDRNGFLIMLVGQDRFEYAILSSEGG